MAKKYFETNKLNTTALSLLFVATFSQPVFGMEENEEEISNKWIVQKKEELTKERKNLRKTQEEQDEKRLKNFFESAVNAEKNNESEQTKKFLKQYISLSKVLNKETDPQVLIKLSQWYSKNSKDDKALKIAKKAAYTENSDAIYHYANMLSQQWSSNPKKIAFSLFEKLSKEGDSRGTFNLAKAYKYGNWIDRDEKKSLELYQKIEHEGNIEELFELAEMYRYGKTVDQDLNKAVELYEKVGGEKGVEGLINLAEMYRYGNNIKKNINKAVEIYEKIGTVDGLFYAASQYYQGNGVNQDKNKALELYQKIELKGDTDSLFDLARMYHEGNVVDQDKKKALELYQKIELKGDKDDLERLAEMYRYGNNIKKNINKAVEIYEKIGTVDGLFYAASQYYYGNGVNQDKKKALELYQKIELEGKIDVLFPLARNYHEGDDVDQDKKKALELYQKIELKGDKDDLFRLARMYHEGNVVDQDKKKALELYQKIELKGQISDLFNLAGIYSVGNNVDQDQKKALELYQKIELKGNREDLCYLARMYHEGHNVKQDLNKAIELYEKVGDNNAFFKLAEIYEHGEGVKDIKKAVGYLEKLAITRNHIDSIEKLKDFYLIDEESVVKNPSILLLIGENISKWGIKLNNKDSISKQKATLYEQAADLGHPKAAYLIGCAYKDGNGVDQDPEKAQLYLKKAVQLGSNEAKVELAKVELEGKTPDFNNIVTLLLGVNFKENDDLKAKVVNLLFNHQEELEENKTTIEQMDHVYFFLGYSRAHSNYNKEEAHSFFEKAVEIAEKKRNAALIGDIANIYLYGKGRLKKSHLKAETLYKKAKAASMRIEKAKSIEWDESSTRERFPQKAVFVQKDGKLTVTTDCSAAYLYQLESEVLKNVKPGDTLKFYSDIEGNAEGITLVVRDKKAQRSLLKTPIELQNGSNIYGFEIVVPENTGDISVLLYNSKITKSGTFTINDLTIEKIEKNVEKSWKLLPFTWDESPKRERFPKKAIFVKKDGKITITTDGTQAHLYQLESQNLEGVKRGGPLMLSYDIVGKAQGTTLVVRDKTNKRPLPKATFSLQDGYNVQDLQFVIPDKTGDISVLLFNEAPMESRTFTINDLKIERVEENVEKSWKLLPFKWDESPKRERFPQKATFIEKDGKITVNTDCSGAHLYQFESEALKDVKFGETIMLSYDIEGNAKGITLVVRDKTNKRPLPNAIFNLQNGYNVQDLQFVIPAGETSVLLYNSEKMENTTFTINSLEFKKVINNK